MNPHLVDHRLVVKVGTEVITTPDGLLDRQRIGHLVDQFMKIRRRFSQVLVVSSGAMGAGRAAYRRTKRADESVAERQKYAAVGQVPLMDAYGYFLGKEGALAGQLLLTKQDFTSRSHYENTRAMLIDMLADPTLTVPVINENDTVATEELTFGDNDQLAGYLARMMRARLLVLLTKEPGLLADIYDPSSVIDRVHPGDDWQQHIIQKTSSSGTGGMQSKCCVASNVARRGIGAVIANGREEHILEKLLLRDAPPPGTWFVPA